MKSIYLVKLVIDKNYFDSIDGSYIYGFVNDSLFISHKGKYDYFGEVILNDYDVKNNICFVVEDIEELKQLNELVVNTFKQIFPININDLSRYFILDVNEIKAENSKVELIYEYEGKEYIYEHCDGDNVVDFDTQIFFHCDGNFGCDCNKSLMMGFKPHFECGEKIKTKSIKFTYY